MDDVFAQQDALARRRKLLEAVMSQSMQAPIVGNTGLGQALAKLGTAWIAGRANKKLDTESAANSEAYSKQLADGMRYMLETAKGGERYGAGGMGPPEAIQPDMLGAAGQGMASRFSELQKLGAAMLPNAFPKPAEPETYSQPMSVQTPEGKLQLAQFGNRGTMRPVQGAQPAPEYASEGGQLWDKRYGTPAGRFVGPTFLPPEQMGGALVQKQEGSGQYREVVGRPPSTTVINQGPAKGEDSFLQSYGKIQAEKFGKALDEGKAAYETLSTLNQMRQLDASGTFDGPAANAATFAGALAKSVGIPMSPKTAARVVNSEALQQQIYRNVALFLLSGSATQISDADRDSFARSLASMANTKEGREQIYAQMEEEARRRVQRARSFQQELGSQYPQFKGPLFTNPMDESGNNGGVTPPLTPPTGGPGALTPPNPGASAPQPVIIPWKR